LVWCFIRQSIYNCTYLLVFLIPYYFNISHSFFQSLNKKWGVEKIHVICVVASEEGINSIAKTHPDVQITVGTIDKELTKDGQICPGIGDAGDRLYGTPLIGDDEELMHPSKRKRSMSVNLE